MTLEGPFHPNYSMIFLFRPHHQSHRSDITHQCPGLQPLLAQGISGSTLKVWQHHRSSQTNNYLISTKINTILKIPASNLA